MIGGGARVDCAEVFDFQNSNQELRKLVDLISQSPGLSIILLVAGEQIQVENPHHGGAGAGWNDHIGTFGKTGEDPLGQFPGLMGESGVVEGLAAASLVEGKIHLHSHPPQNSHHASTDLRIKLIYNAGGEQGNFYWSGASQSYTNTILLALFLGLGIAGPKRSRRDRS